MKKLYTVLSILLAFLLLSGCGSKIDDDALHAYVQARQKMIEMKSASVDAKMLMDANDLGVHSKLSVSGKYNAQSKLEMAFNMDVAINGIGLEDLAKLYYKDDAIYANIMDSEKICIPLNLSYLWNLSSDKRTNLSEDDIKETFDELSMETVDGKRVITGTLKDEGLKSISNTANSFLIGYTYETGEDTRVEKIQDATYTLTVDDNDQCEKMVINVRAIVDYSDENAEKQTTSTDIEIQFVFKDINQIDHIEFPSFKDYVKSDSLTNEAGDILDELEEENPL